MKELEAGATEHIFASFVENGTLPVDVNDLAELGEKCFNVLADVFDEYEKELSGFCKACIGGDKSRSLSNANHSAAMAQATKFCTYVLFGIEVVVRERGGLVGYRTALFYPGEDSLLLTTDIDIVLEWLATMFKMLLEFCPSSAPIAMASRRADLFSAVAKHTAESKSMPTNEILRRLAHLYAQERKITSDGFTEVCSGNVNITTMAGVMELNKTMAAESVEVIIERLLKQIVASDKLQLATDSVVTAAEEVSQLLPASCSTFAASARTFFRALEAQRRIEKLQPVTIWECTNLLSSMHVAESDVGTVTEFIAAKKTCATRVAVPNARRHPRCGH